jgi:hypothetical protein
MLGVRVTVGVEVWVGVGVMVGVRVTVELAVGVGVSVGARVAVSVGAWVEGGERGLVLDGAGGAAGATQEAIRRIRMRRVNV